MNIWMWYSLWLQCLELFLFAEGEKHCKNSIFHIQMIIRHKLSAPSVAIVTAIVTAIV